MALASLEGFRPSQPVDNSTSQGRAVHLLTDDMRAEQQAIKTDAEKAWDMSPWPRPVGGNSTWQGLHSQPRVIGAEYLPSPIESVSNSVPQNIVYMQEPTPPALSAD